MQIIKISHLTKVAIKTRTSRFFHRNLSGSPDIRTEINKKTHNFLKKQGSFYAKQEKNRKKVPLFFILHFVTEKNTHINSKKRNYSKQKHFGLRLTPHFPPYFPPLCGVSTAQVVWLFPDASTQTIFDLPKTMMPISDLSGTNRHTDSQSVQPWSFPFISTTLCAKCSKRNSYFCPKLNIRFSPFSKGLRRRFSTLRDRARRANQDTLRQYEYPRTQRTRDCTPQLPF